ncbi:MAG: hypothetical protein RL333_567 [Pseudomonadota bacterium]|jgi:hypothetical protein
MSDHEVNHATEISGSVDAWIHRQFMEGCDELCFTYRREVEHLRELVTELKTLPATERKQHRGTLKKWRRIEKLEIARLKAS